MWLFFFFSYAMATSCLWTCMFVSVSGRIVLLLGMHVISRSMLRVDLHHFDQQLLLCNAKAVETGGIPFYHQLRLLSPAASLSVIICNDSASTLSLPHPSVSTFVGLKWSRHMWGSFQKRLIQPANHCSWYKREYSHFADVCMSLNLASGTNVSQTVWSSVHSPQNCSRCTLRFYQRTKLNDTTLWRSIVEYVTD